MNFEIGVFECDKDKIMEVVNSPEFMKPFNDYIERVEKEAMSDLSEENRLIYQDIMNNRRSQKQDGKELYEWNREVHNAVMWSISMGLG